MGLVEAVSVDVVVVEAVRYAEGPVVIRGVVRSERAVAVHPGSVVAGYVVDDGGAANDSHAVLGRDLPLPWAEESLTADAGPRSDMSLSRDVCSSRS